ncbi:hypothetical protein GEMRC1_006490 [Eukaryota sp. GEM-RC1]
MLEPVGHFSTRETISSCSTSKSSILLGTSSGKLLLYDVDRHSLHQMQAHSGEVCSCFILPSKSLVISASLDGSCKTHLIPFSDECQVSVWPQPFRADTSSTHNVSRSIQSMTIDPVKGIVVLSLSPHSLVRTCVYTPTSTLAILSIDHQSLRFLHYVPLSSCPPLSLHSISDPLTGITKFLIGHSHYTSANCFISLDSDVLISNKSVLPSASSTIHSKHHLPPCLANAGSVPVTSGYSPEGGFIRFSSTSSSITHSLPFGPLSSCPMKLPSSEGVLVCGQQLRPSTACRANGGKSRSTMIQNILAFDMRNGAVSITFDCLFPNLQAVRVTSSDQLVIVVAKQPGSRRNFIFYYSFNFKCPVLVSIPRPYDLINLSTCNQFSLQSLEKKVKILNY